MPLPLGHMSVGLVAYELSTRKVTGRMWWKTALYVGVMASLPDIDVPIGLLFAGNGWAFHRGPTHSAVFALLTAFLASRAWKVWTPLPRVGFVCCFSVIFSHVLSDLLFTASPVSLWWPFELHWASGYIGWDEVAGSVYQDTCKDADLIVAGSVLTVLIRTIKKGCLHYFGIGQRVLLRASTKVLP